jgi:hypothetical protein
MTSKIPKKPAKQIPSRKERDFFAEVESEYILFCNASSETAERQVTLQRGKLHYREASYTTERQVTLQIGKYSVSQIHTLYSYPMSMNQTVMPCIMGTPVRDQKNANVRIISMQSSPPPPVVRRRPINNRPSTEATCCPEQIMLPLDMGCETRGSKFLLRRRDVSKKDQDYMMEVAMPLSRPTKANIVEIKGECIPIFTNSQLPREGRIIKPRFDFPLSHC